MKILEIYQKKSGVKLTISRRAGEGSGRAQDSSNSGILLSDSEKKNIIY
jgi:hypothetical protein